MKKLQLLFVIFISGFQLHAQDSIPVKTNNEPIVYTFVYNKVPDGYNVPLIGFINNASGNHRGLQVGFSNSNGGNFNGLEVGFANTVGDNNSGVQVGFFNTIGQSSNGINVGFFNTIGKSGKGFQYGFFNTLGDSFLGIQCGFFNTLGNSGKGLQAGFFNTLGNSFQGIQCGFFNTLGNKMEGVQVGFINTVGKKTEGVQVGFLNTTPILSGVQVGFLNRIDTIENGIPIGFLSFVKKGGYQVIELGASEMFPVNISYKTGIKQFYTSLVVSYNPISYNHFGIGMGLGSLIPINEKLYFNPEFISQTTCTVLWDQIYSLHLNLNYKLSKRFSILAGPSLAWNHLKNGNNLHTPYFWLYKKEINAGNNLLIGLNAAVNFQVGK